MDMFKFYVLQLPPPPSMYGISQHKAAIYQTIYQRHLPIILVFDIPLVRNQPFNTARFSYQNIRISTNP